VTEVREVLTNAGTLFPALGRGPLELAGFVWFQGWNDSTARGMNTNPT